jgi:glycosyltransferase involved in cell wall biosynthesis
MNKPLVSIVMPLYNKEAYVQNALKSILGQSYTNWELIIVDDGSTDASSRLASEFIASNKMLARVVPQSNSGPSAARNAGIKMSSGVFVALLDADDLWMPTKLEEQVDFMLRNSEIDLTLTNYVIFNSQKRVKLKAIRAKDPLKQILNWLNMRGFGGLVESTGMFKRESLDEDLFFDQSMNTTEGLDFSLKWFLHKRIKVLPEFLTLYRISENQLHRNVDEIKKNVSRVSLNYPFLLNATNNSAACHKAYFELSNLRGLSLLKKLQAIVGRFLRMDFVFFSMTISIISRNLRARVILPSLRRELLNNLRRNAL